VPGPQFYFALEFSSQSVPASLLGDLAAQVLGYAGCTRQELPELAGALEQAAETSTVGVCCCDVQFCAQNGTLEILVSSNAGRIFRISKSIPDRS
jgi:hypothetical protein